MASSLISVATAENTSRVWFVQRLPEDVRWSWDSVIRVCRAKWNLCQGDEKADGNIPEGKAVGCMRKRSPCVLKVSE